MTSWTNKERAAGIRVSGRHVVRLLGSIMDNSSCVLTESELEQIASAMALVKQALAGLAEHEHRQMAQTAR